MNEEIHEVYQVESIIGKRIVKRKTYYLVKWVGYPVEESTWQPCQNLKKLGSLKLRYHRSLLPRKSEKLSESSSQQLQLQLSMRYHNNNHAASIQEESIQIVNHLVEDRQLYFIVSQDGETRRLSEAYVHTHFKQSVLNYYAVLLKGQQSTNESQFQPIELPEFRELQGDSFHETNMFLDF